MGSIDTAGIDKLFGGLATAEVFGSGNYFEAGIHVVTLKDIFCKEGFKGKSLIAEFEIVSSSDASVSVGSTRSYVLKMESPYAPANAAKLFMALLGYENTKENLTNGSIRKECEVTARAVMGSETAQKELGDIYRPDMLKGARLKVECSLRDTKPSLKSPNGGVWTDHAWSPAGE